MDEIYSISHQKSVAVLITALSVIGIGGGHARNEIQDWLSTARPLVTRCPATASRFADPKGFAFRLFRQRGAIYRGGREIGVKMLHRIFTLFLAPPRRFCCTNELSFGTEWKMTTPNEQITSEVLYFVSTNAIFLLLKNFLK